MLESYTEYTFSARDISHSVHRKGAGPPVIVMHEVPGITPQVAAFAERVVADGFTVFLPDMFGQAGRPMTNGYTVKELGKACINREFRVFATRRSSPITQWLRALSRQIHEEFGGAGVGAIGMCLTGNFALALMVDPWLMAPVLSQPSLPIGPTRASRRALHLSDDDLSTIKGRALNEGQCILGMRFSNDFMCPPQRFDRLREEFGERFEAIEIDSSKGNPHGFTRQAHSVVTTEFMDEDGFPTKIANDRVMSFFHENLDRVE